jgi:hypothetical protein
MDSSTIQSSDDKPTADVGTNDQTRDPKCKDCGGIPGAEKDNCTCKKPQTPRFKPPPPLKPRIASPNSPPPLGSRPTAPVICGLRSPPPPTRAEIDRVAWSIFQEIFDGDERKLLGYDVDEPA